MKRFCYHREFWMDFHFWILVLLLAAVALTMRAPLSVVSLAYLAFVKDGETYRKMSQELKIFIRKNNISTFEIFSYQRFGRNYLLYLPLKKKIYYLLYFMGQEKLLQKLV